MMRRRHDLFTLLLREPLLETLLTVPVLGSLAHDRRVEREIEPWLNVWVPWERPGPGLEMWMQARPDGAWRQWERWGEDENRRLLRWWACARVDALLTGDEQFTAHAWQGGEPYWVRELGQAQRTRWSEEARVALAGVTAIRVGPSESVQVGKKGRENVHAVKACWGDEALLADVERVLFPWLECVDLGRSWEEVVSLIERTRPFRQWATSRSLPLVMRGVVLDTGNLPDGVEPLIPLEEWSGHGLGADALYTLGVSLFAPSICVAWTGGPSAVTPKDPMEQRELVIEHVARYLGARPS